VLILADDLGYSDLGCYRAPGETGGAAPGDAGVAATPNLDAMAADGIRFTQYYSPSPICSPSRAGLLTGMFPARWRITSYLQSRKGNRACEQADFLDPAAPSIARQFQSAGYATAHFGKWHLGGGRDVTDAPKFSAYGFDEHAGTWESPEPHPDITTGDKIWSPDDRVKRWERTAFFVDKTLDFLKRHPGRPCYVQLWPDDVHTPWVPASDASGRGNSPEKLRAVLAELDRQIGRLLDGIRELGIDGDTIVLFTGDNGPDPAFHPSRAGGLRGQKRSLYEGGTREPLIVRWPGRIPAGRVDGRTVICGVDLLPTLCALAGAPTPRGVTLDGEDLSPAFLGNPADRQRPLFWEYGRNPDSFKYPEGRDRSPNVALREGGWKLLVNADGTRAELYDLSSDPAESKNLASAHPERAARMAAAALAWWGGLPKE
jgi:arylsulfatase A-like enzyme